MNTNNQDNRPILYDYFKDSADVLLAEYQRSKGQKSAANVGYNRELFCNKFLSRVLPPRLNVRRGEIWDSQGNRTGQLEVVILRDDTPSLAYGEADTFLAEGVFAVVEVKSNLTKVKLQEALTTLKRMKKLNPKGGVKMFSGPVLDRPLRCILAYEGATWVTLGKELAKPENDSVVDLVSILNSGILISRGLLLNWKGDEKFGIYEGKAASLAWLYYHLVRYSTSFIARSFDITEYFNPIEGWSDS